MKEEHGDPAGETVTRGYVLQRFMNACSGRGGSPIKFNGSIFTVEAKPGASPETPAGDPDWRQWGGNYWFQNTRLAYWPMLAAGDFEMMEPWFRMYRQALPLSKARIKTYYSSTAPRSFPETMYCWGLPNNGDYGWNNTAPEPANGYIRRYWNGSLELIAVMLDRYDFTQDERVRPRHARAAGRSADRLPRPVLAEARREREDPFRSGPIAGNVARGRQPAAGDRRLAVPAAAPAGLAGET